MAYQPKSYKKFVATAATATLVASAIAPVASAASFTDVADRYKEAVDYIVGKGYAQGYPGGTKYGTDDNIKRQDAAVMIARALGAKEDGNYPNAGFTDVPADRQWAVNFLAEKKIVSGLEAGKFGANAFMTRGEMAKVIANAYNLKGNPDNEFPFTDVSATFKEYVDALQEAGVAQGYEGTTQFGTGDNVTRGHFALFVHRAETDVVAPITTATKVVSVSAINATTLTLTGTNLSALKAEDIKVEDNTVKSVVASTDGKTATVTLESQLVLDTTTKVTVKETDKETDFNVTYSINATDVAVVEGATYDDDTEDQYVKLLVDGKELTAPELISAGYTVEFEAFTKKSALSGDAAPIFVNGATTSTTGELDSAITLNSTVDDYYVRATVTNGSEVMISDVTKIQIRNKNIAADGITDVVLLNLGTDGAFVAGTDFEQASSTLVTGEKAEISEITVKSGSTTEVLQAGDFTVKSSNEAVVSADEDNNYELEAQGPGTATLTISYGGSTFTKTITVKSEARKETSVKVEKTSVAVKETGTASVKVQLLDQYGDPMPFVADTDLKVVGSDDETATGVLTAPTTSEKLEGKLTISGVDTGTAVFTFRNGANTKLGSTSVRATVTNNEAISQYLLSVDNDITNDDLATINTDNTLTLTKNDISTDATIDTGDDRYVKIRVKGANSAGQVIVDKPAPTTEYIVSNVSPSDVDVLDTSFGTDGVAVKEGYILVKAGSEDGSATITVKDVVNPSIIKTFKVTVTDKGFTVSGVTFKNVPAITYAQELNVKDFLSYTKSSNDFIINGLKLTNAVSQSVRLEAASNILYIDKNGNGSLDAGTDVEVGSIQLSTTGTFTNGLTTDSDGFETLNVVAGDDGTVFFKVLNTGDDKVVGNDDEVIATKSVKVDF